MSRIDTNEMHKIIVELKNNNMDVFDEFYELTKRQVYVSILSIVKNIIPRIKLTISPIVTLL